MPHTSKKEIVHTVISEPLAPEPQETNRWRGHLHCWSSPFRDCLQATCSGLSRRRGRASNSRQHRGERLSGPPRRDRRQLEGLPPLKTRIPLLSLDCVRRREISYPSCLASIGNNLQVTSRSHGIVIRTSDGGATGAHAPRRDFAVADSSDLHPSFTAGELQSPSRSPCCAIRHGSMTKT